MVYFVGNESTSEEQKKGLAVVPHVAMSFASDSMFLIESSQKGIDFSNIDELVDYFRVSTGISMLVFNILFFAVLSIYLDQVVPNENGQRKHPLFFLNCLRKSSKDRKRSGYELHENLQSSDSSTKDKFEPVDHVLREQE